MKTITFLLFFSFSISTLLAQDFYLNSNGVTCMCPAAAVGDTGVVNGITYTKRTAAQITEANAATTCTSGITSMYQLFYQSNDFNQDISTWDVSSVTNMYRMFRGTYNFNQDIGFWDVSNVTTMEKMFFSTAFNQPIGDWDVSSVTNMFQMFRDSDFNQPIGDWDVSNVSNMKEMFLSTPFDQPIGDWDVSNVSNMEKMFQSTPFNQPIGDWDVSSVTNMFQMFGGNFNQPIGNWDVSSVTNMSSMLGRDFNQPIGNWDVSSVTNMYGMFGGGDFNQPIGDWDVSSVTDMSYMFYTNLNFTQDISTWDVSSVTDMNYMFAASNFNQPIGAWDVGNVTDMSFMFFVDDFFGASVYFNQPIGDWDVSSVINMQQMFYKHEVFNQPIGDWDVSNVTSMSAMFNGATAFNQPIGDWDVSNVTSIGNMFQSATAFNQNISNWQFNTNVNFNDFIDNSGLDINNYDALLAGFSNQNLLDRVLNAENLVYCNVSARDDLITNKGWTISGDSYSFSSLTAPNNTSIDPDPNTCVATNVDLGTPTVITECGFGSLTNNAPNEFPIGQTQVVWTLVDENGFATTDTQTVTVIFNQPIITAPNNLNIDPDPSSCVAENVDLGTPTVTGGCGVATISNNAPNDYPIGVTQVVWTLVDGSGIEDTDIQTVTVTLQVDVADVCYVSSDQTQVSNNRVFITNDPTNSGLNVEYYEVLREAPSGNYETIGFINPPEVSFLDTDSDNNTQAYRYKIQTTDVCGANYPETPYHKTILLQSGIASDNSINLSWTPYIGLDFSTYNVYKNTNGTGYELLTSLAASNTTYNDTAANVLDNAYEYYIAIEAPDCNTAPLMSEFIKSNLEYINPNLGISDLSYLEKSISLFPNPTSSQVAINTSNGIDIIRVELYNVLGQQINIASKSTIEMSYLPSGLYYLQISTDLGTVTKTIIRK